MSRFRDVTSDFAVSPQIEAADVAAARAEGFRLIINNRPDGEAPGQPASAEIEAAARAEGLEYVHIPVSGRPTMDQVEAENRAIEAAKGPALAYCRSGTRSIFTWAIGRQLAGKVSRDELVSQAARAGYDISSALPPG
jgi:uncharacterized protein (TIGR01244 family)